ncbi:matrix metalloproteinase-17-like [Lytechinus pictus]|uniref:matrix metalloproteinase-17-like n=1 Tax=Lytechinus pictus TaxID=7653 RepID=UPI00240DEEBF|nr:matrix metalloproteinase-17-like [Lytechinus pictus]
MQKYEYTTATRGVEDPEETRQAIMRLQRMAGITPTGMFNNETIARIKNSKRCGNSDKPVDTEEMRKRRYAIQHGWSKRRLTWAIKNFTPDMDRATTNRVLTSSFQVWSDVARLDFTQTKFPRADILVVFARRSHGDGYPFDGPGGTLAHAYFPGDGIGGDVHFDEDEQFTDRTLRGTNLFIVAAHEIGHSLGLAHSDVGDSLMAPYYQGFKSTFQLHSDDIRGIQSLYGARSTPPNRPRPPPGSPNIPSKRPKDMAICNAPINAVTYGQIAGSPAPSLYIFSGERFWIKRGSEAVSNALQTESVFVDMQSIPDAAFIRSFRGQKRMVFFSGSEIWEYSAGTYHPQDIRQRTGIRANKIDAAFKWARNNKIYLFSNGLYWRLNENTLRADPGYPRVIKDNWRGRSGPFDAAWTEGKGGVSHFLTGKDVNTFKDNEVYFVTPRRSFASDWLMCGQNIGSGTKGPITVSGTLFLVSTLVTLKRVL